MTRSTTHWPLSRAARHGPGPTGLRPRRGWELHPGVRSGGRLSRGERAANLLRDGLGAWGFAAAAAGLAGAGIVVTLRRDGGDPFAVLVAVMSGAALVELSVLLMAARRADRTAGEVALYDLSSARREAAAVQELREEVERLRTELAALTARLQAGQWPGIRGGGRS